MVLTRNCLQNFRKSPPSFCFVHVLSQSCRFQKHALFSLPKTEQSISSIRSPMKFLFKSHFSFFDRLLVLVSFCALYFFFFFFIIRYFKIKTRGKHKHHNHCKFTPPNKEPILEEDCSENLQKSIDFEEKEAPFSALSFQFPTYEEFIRTRDNGSVPSNPDPDFDLHHRREDPENFPQNNLNCTDEFRDEDLDIKEENPKDADRNESVEEAMPGSCDRKIDNSDEFESEEEDLVELLQMEIVKGKGKGHGQGQGLPPIPEESEYTIPMEEDLKPWRTEENFKHRDFATELHKCHEIYTEKMQKYDTLNHQKLNAKDLKLMQSKDSVDSVLSKSLCRCRPKKGDLRAGKSREFEGDLEVVYVVQLWVSWEFLVWQYNKALELSDRGDCGSCRFNEVAGKFEHFQVVIQRFMENEPFEQGSRVECYARNRLGRRKLLQVPLIKEDEVKDNMNKEETEDGDDDNHKYAIKIDRLIEILQESIRILWQFIRTDKLARISTLKFHIEADQECKSPTHSNILKQIFSDLQKKERNLKKMMRRKNLRETVEDDQDDELYFFSLVDLKLVSRALNMQKITRDQLSWCRHKLSCISFLSRKIKVEPSSFIFPS